MREPYTDRLSGLGGRLINGFNHSQGPLGARVVLMMPRHTTSVPRSNFIVVEKESCLA